MMVQADLTVSAGLLDMADFCLGFVMASFQEVIPDQNTKPDR